MQPPLKRVMVVLLILLAMSTGALSAAEPPAIPAPLPLSESRVDLKPLQLRLDNLKQQISSTTNYNQLQSPLDQVQVLILDIDRLSNSLLPEQAQLKAQLAVLGTAPAEKMTPEESDIAQQRSALTAQKNQIDTDLASLTALKESAVDLLTQIAVIRRSLLESELTLRTGSVLNPDFWVPLVDPPQADRQRLKFFADQVLTTTASAWHSGKWFYSALLITLAAIIWIPGRQLAERGLFWWCVHRVPDGRLRRSSLALASVLATLLTTACALHVLFYACTRHVPLPPMLATFSDGFEKVVYTCVLITALSRALLSAEHPSWRLPTITNPVAEALQPFPRILASTLLMLMTWMQIINAAGLGSPAVINGRGIIALAVTAIVVTLLWRTGNVRKAAVVSGAAPETGSTLTGLLYTMVSLATLTAGIALITGYVSLGRFITYELVWVFMIFAGFYLLTQLFKDGCEYLLSPRQPSGKALKQVLGISDSRLEQIAIVVSGVGRAGLLLLAVISLLVGGIGTTLEQLISNIFNILGGAGLRKLNVVPGHLFNALLALAIGIYLIRALGRWLDNEFLPKTNMDPGMCASLSTLFANMGYALVILLALSSLGVEWTNLAWIVSALSVGIGFGLQEIVKNFVSGLILLTERPVKVGDLISISGVEGDIRRINVRATEIQLSDRSIVIVPNSQLISQNLRNVTLGGSAQGVATLELMFPLDIDPEQVQNLLHDAYTEHQAILAKPAPFVRFSKLTPEGITLTVTGYVSSPRIVGSTKSELLFEILKRLGSAGIALAKPAVADS